MKSRFYFSYATIFFFLLFFFANLEGEPGSGTLVFALSLAIFYESVNLIANIDGFVQFVFGIIFVILAGYCLYLLPPEYSIFLLVALIPMYILPYFELYLGSESYKILVISIFEVFSLALFVITAYAGVLAKMDKVVPGFMLNGANFEEAVGSAFINLFSVVIMWTGIKEIGKKE